MYNNNYLLIKKIFYDKKYGFYFMRVYLYPNHLYYFDLRFSDDVLNRNQIILETTTKLNVTMQMNTMKKMPKFWTNSGFCPPAPIEDDSITSYLLSNDVFMNMEILAALPNNAITNIRVHWILHLLRIGKRYNNNNNKINITNQFDFIHLDKFINHLHNIHLYPTIEFMINSSDILSHQDSSFWNNLIYALIQRYIGTYF